jgi:hypothetical protein
MVKPTQSHEIVPDRLADQSHCAELQLLNLSIFGGPAATIGNTHFAGVAIFLVSAIHSIRRNATAISSAFLIGAANATGFARRCANLTAFITDQAQAAFRTGISALTTVLRTDLGTELGTSTNGQTDLIFRANRTVITGMVVRVGTLTAFQADCVSGTYMAALAEFRPGLRASATGQANLVL